MTPLERLVKAAEALLPVLSPIGYVDYHIAVKELRDALAAVAEAEKKRQIEERIQSRGPMSQPDMTIGGQVAQERAEPDADTALRTLSKLHSEDHRDLTDARDAIRLAHKIIDSDGPIHLSEIDTWLALPAVKTARGEKG